MSAAPPAPPAVAIVIAAHNEQSCIAATLTAALTQNYPVSQVVLMADNCTDDTVAIGRSFPGVTVIETVDNTQKKVGALNQAWAAFPDMDYFACLDADTIIPPDSVGAWVEQMVREDRTAGISARFTMQPSADYTRWGNLLARLQKAEFARWTDTALNQGGNTTVLAGTACMLRVAALDELFAERERLAEGTTGPWTHASDVEDFELTFRLRQLGWNTKVSYAVRAYTAPMTSLSTLWAQRMKWQGGTCEDLLRFGLNRWTWRSWGQQALGLLAAAVRIAWISLTLVFALAGILQLNLVWLLVPVLFVVNDIKHSMRVPHRDALDVVLAATLVPQELFAWMRAGWFLKSWAEVLVMRVTGHRKDRWAIQYAAEAVAAPAARVPATV